MSRNSCQRTSKLWVWVSPKPKPPQLLWSASGSTLGVGEREQRMWCGQADLLTHGNSALCQIRTVAWLGASTGLAQSALRWAVAGGRSLWRHSARHRPQGVAVGHRLDRVGVRLCGVQVLGGCEFVALRPRGIKPFSWLDAQSAQRAVSNRARRGAPRVQARRLAGGRVTATCIAGRRPSAFQTHASTCKHACSPAGCWGAPSPR